MMRWLNTYQQSDPDPFGRDIPRETVVHAYDTRLKATVHPVDGPTYGEHKEEPWAGWAGPAAVCPVCVAFMEDKDLDETA